MEPIRAIPAILSEVASFLLGKAWTAVSQSWYTRAAAVFFTARPFLIAAMNVWGLRKAAEILGRSLENAARILNQRQQQRTVSNIHQVSTGSSTIVS